MGRSAVDVMITLALSLRRTVKVGLVAWRHKKEPAFWLVWLLFLASLVSFFRQHEVRVGAGVS
jgi:phosphatidylglycerophosphate synthase